MDVNQFERLLDAELKALDRDTKLGDAAKAIREMLSEADTGVLNALAKAHGDEREHDLTRAAISASLSDIPKGQIHSRRGLEFFLSELMNRLQAGAGWTGKATD